MEVIGIAQARPKLGEIANRAQYKDEPTAITREGNVVAVVISRDMALEVWGIVAGTINGGRYAELRRELRLIAPGEGGE